MTRVSSTVETKTGRAAQVAAPGKSLEFVKREYGEPGTGQVRLAIQACGICHSDSFPFHGGFPGQVYPAVPGHELIGIVDATGEGVSRLKPGDRVGVGWHGGHCHQCDSCRKGDFITCSSLPTPGISIDGGYAEYGIFNESACAMVPAGLDSAEAGPLMCAGVTTFNALRHAGAGTGDTVAILGLGGLGHLGVQFASKMGYRTVGIARGSEKAEFARELGAHEYIDSTTKDSVETLQKMGGARVILSTIISSDAMTPWVDALSIDGKMLIVGADIKPMQLSPIALIGQRRSIAGWPSGTARDSEDCLRFCELTGIRPMIERYPFDRAAEAFERMMSGKARFRVVIEHS
ncbi:MAG: alcohol dehydrogenase catalytic domain-containing protein [Cyanobacteria bacterium HKST-UBA02]|nr:alcohol dehydrogenase catalytic domain-containing protein [Cyanobacteria bacterium HKST-UBA02]